MRNKKGDVRPTYTKIYHDKRIDLKLNLLEYVVVETVYSLSHDSKGYCYKSIRAMARDLGMSFDGVRKAIIRLTKSGMLVSYKDGYRASDTFIDKVHSRDDRSAVRNKQTFDRSAVQDDRLAVTTDRSVAPQQMLELYKNNNRDTYDGSPRIIPREPEQTKPLSVTALRLQRRLERMRSIENR